VVAEAVPPLSGTRVLTAWQFAPPVDAVLCLLAAGYLAAAWRIGRRHPARPWPAWRAGAFLLGLAVIVIAGQSSAAVYDDVLFSAHMVQHLLLIMVAPPLLVVGRPVTLLMHALGNPAHTWLKRAVRSRVASALTWPPAAALAYAAVVAGTHTPPVMDLVVRSQAAHLAEHGLYLLAGYLFFLLIAGSEPIRWRVSLPGRFVLLLAAMQVDTVVGVVFMVAGHEVFGAYRQPRGWGPAPLADLHQGGVIMWVGSDIVMIVIALVVAAGMVGAGAPARPGSGRAEEASLAAYNAYLATLDRARRHSSHEPAAASAPAAGTATAAVLPGPAARVRSTTLAVSAFAPVAGALVRMAWATACRMWAAAHSAPASARPRR
jgi:putative copper resistance protein D